MSFPSEDSLLGSSSINAPESLALAAKQASFGHNPSEINNPVFSTSQIDYSTQHSSQNNSRAITIGGDDDDEEAFYENPLEVIRDFGNHPLMDRAQKALVSQLQEISDKLRISLITKKDELKKVNDEREQLGVQLYALQQQLTSVQTQLENCHQEYNGIIDVRIAEEELIKELDSSYKQQKALAEEYEKQLKNYNKELDNLNDTIRQIENFNTDIESDIKISRRVTYKVEKNMQELEKAKEDQDILVENLTKKIKSLTKNISLIKNQLKTQKNDTNDANTILKETLEELELINNEKKQIILQWKATLIGLSRRDEALAQSSLTLQAAESAVHDYDVEIEATRRELQKEQEKHENLVNMKDRMENELTITEDKLEKKRIEKAQLEERYTLLKKSLNHTENDMKKVDIATKNINMEAESVNQNLQIVQNERQKIEDELQIYYSTLSNVNKAVANLDKNFSKVLKQIHAKENDILMIENKLANYKVEKLNITSLIDQLKENLEVTLKELKEKEALVSKYQLEIRQRNDEIEKKMYRVDRLNKKYEKMVESAGGEENLGPLENTIKNLNKEIDAITSECKEFEREWLKRQTEMVSLSSVCETMAENNNEVQARVTVLVQQQIRLTKELNDVKSKVKVLNQVNNDYQKDISKLNTLISQNHDQETSLQAQNLVLEMDSVEELKEKEKDCIQIQTQINEVRVKKEELLDEIIEMERQAMLWEKKIQLDKETRSALDPTVGVAENQNMEKEIHRMQIRLETLKREQEKLSVEMEKAVLKRSTIATRYSTSKSTTLGSNNAKDAFKDVSIAQAKKKISGLKKESRDIAEEIMQYNFKLEEKKKAVQDISFSLEQFTAQYGDAEETCHQLQTTINNLLYEKQLYQERISYRQKFCTRLRELTNGNQSVDLSQALGIERKWLSSNQTLDNVKEILIELKNNFPHLEQVLDRVLNMTFTSIDLDNNNFGNNENISPNVMN